MLKYSIIILLQSRVTGSEVLKQLTSQHLVETCHSVDRTLLIACDSVTEPKMSVHAIKNTRRKMEDKHVLLPYFGKLFDNAVRLFLYCFILCR